MILARTVVTLVANTLDLQDVVFVVVDATWESPWSDSQSYVAICFEAPYPAQKRVSQSDLKQGSPTLLKQLEACSFKAQPRIPVGQDLVRFSSPAARCIGPLGRRGSTLGS